MFATDPSLPSVGWGDIASLLGAVVSLGAAVVTTIYASRALTATRVANRLAYFSGLRAWADEVSTAVETAIHVCGDLDPARPITPTFFERRFDLICKLAALLERGRWFFPNVAKQRGEKDEVIFRGYRHEMLDSVFAAYLKVRAIDFNDKTNNRQTKSALEVIEKQFVEQVLVVLDPARGPLEYQLLVGHTDGRPAEPRAAPDRGGR